MKYIHIFLIAAFATVAFFLGRNALNSNEPLENNVRAENTETNSSSKINQNSQGKATYNDNNDNCPALSVLNNMKKAEVSDRKEQGKYLVSRIKINKLSTGAESYILQLTGLTHLNYLRYKSGKQYALSDLPAVDGRPEPLPTEIKSKLSSSIKNADLEEILHEIKKSEVHSNSIIAGNSVISTMLLNENFKTEEAVTDFILRSKLKTNFSDLVNSIKSDADLPIIRALTSSYSGELHKTWRFNHITSNLATFSAQSGRPELVQFWLEKGVPAIVVDKNGNAINTILDMTASFKLSKNKALPILNISEAHNVTPAGYDAYLFYNELVDETDTRLQQYLNKIKVGFTSQYNFTTLPEDINASVNFIIKINESISGIEKSIEKCYPPIVSDTDDADQKNTLTAAEKITSPSAAVDDLNEQEKNLFTFLADKRILLKEKQYQRYIDAISSYPNTEGNYVLSAALIQALDEGVPIEVVDKLILLGAKIPEEALTLMAIKNDVKLIQAFNTSQNDFVLTKAQKLKINQLSEIGVVKESTLKTLDKLGYL